MVRRCDEAYRRIRFIESLCAQYKKVLRPPQNVDTFLANIQELIAKKGKDSMAYFEELEQTLVDTEKFLTEQQKEAEAAFSRQTQLAQHRYVLNAASEIVLARAK
jgi:hypothetical protein